MCYLKIFTTACKGGVHVLRIFSLSKCVKKAVRVHVAKNDNTVVNATSSFDQQQEKEVPLLFLYLIHHKRISQFSILVATPWITNE